MKNKAIGILIVVIMIVLSLGIVGCDGSNTSISSNIISAQSTEVVQLCTSVEELDIPADLTSKPLDALTIWYPANYYLDKDWTGSSALVGSINILSGNAGTVFLDLRGHSISVASGLPVIKVSSGYMVVYDSVGGGCIIGANSSYSLGGGGVYVSTNGDFSLYAGATITGNATQSSSYVGGGVYNDGTFNMYGGTISDNNCAGLGGGVYNNGTFNMSGGTISGNKAGTGYYGSGVYNAGTFNMSGGTISGNISSSGGGGVANVGTMIMSDGSITGNISSLGGGGILNTGVLEISGGDVTNNTTGGNGGGIFMSGDSGTVDLSGTVSITGNTAGGSGGGIYCNSNTLCVEGNVSITNNLSGAGVSNIYIVEGQTITITGDITSQIGVAYALGTGDVVVAADGYTITDDVAAMFSSDNTKYYQVLNAAGSTITLYNMDDVVTTTSEETITYSKDGYNVLDLMDIASSYDVEYSLTTISGEAFLDGETLQVTTVGTFVLSASAKATSTSDAAKWQLTLTVEPMEVYVSEIDALSRGIDENNIYVDLDETTGTIKDASGDVIDGLSIDFSSAYGVIDDEYYYNDATLGDEAQNNFTVTVENIKLSGDNSANYVIESIEPTNVDIYSGYPLVAWATVGDITYGDTMTNDSLLGGKVVVYDGETEEYITVGGSFVWVETPTLESVGSYSYAIKFVVDKDDSNYAEIEDYVTDIELLIHYVNYDVNADAVIFNISNNALELDSTDEPTITASTSSGATVDEYDYTILYFKVDDGVNYYSFEGDVNGDGSYENPYQIDTSTADTYLIGAELSVNYHHSGTVENTAKQIGVLYVGVTPETYSVTFNDASGEEIDDLTIAYSYLNSIIIMPEYSGGIGWVNAKGVFYEFGDRYPQTAYDETFTLAIVADSVTIAGTVIGTDLDGISGNLDGVMVQLMQGSEVIETVVTSSNGAYSFSVAEGNYTLVVTRKLTGLTNIVSVMVDATESDQTVDVTLPSTRQNVVLEVESGFTGITVEGLESLVPDEENTITISVDSAETNGVEQTAILELAAESGYTTSNVKLYFDINFTEQPSSSSAVSTFVGSSEVPVEKVASEITFYIPLAGIYQYKDTYIVYVYDDYGNVYELDTDSYTCDGETLTITTDTAGVYALAFVTTLDTFEGEDATATYSADAIELSDMFDDIAIDGNTSETVDITDATYTIGENSTGVGSIDGNTLIVDKVGDFEIIITTKETATAYSYVGTATLTVEPMVITITGVVGEDRGLIEDNVVVDLDTTDASLGGMVDGDDITINFDNAYGAIVESGDSTTYYYDYDQGASSWDDQQAVFAVLIVGATLEGDDSGNYILEYSYTDVTITTSVPYIAWPTATSILYGQDLTDSVLYGGTVVIYSGGEYIEFSTDDCDFEWMNETTYNNNFETGLSISELSVGTYTQQVKVSIKTTATDYKADYNTILADYTYYVTFEIVADAVEFVVSNNVFEVDSDVSSIVLSIDVNTGSGEEIDASDYDIVFFNIENDSVVYYSLTGSADGDGSYGNAKLISTAEEHTYLIGALFSYSDGVYNYHHSGSADSTAKQIGTLYITDSTIATYTTIFMVGSKTETAKTGVVSGDILILPTLESADYIGWEYDGVVYDFGARFTQPTSNVVFTAVTAPTTYQVSGAVTGLALGVDSGDLTAISGVGVALYQGSQLIATTTTDASGEYTFSVAAGNYSLVITRTQGIENIITKYLSVEGNTTVETIEIPNIRQNTVVSVDTGVESVVVEGIDDLHTEGEENTYTVTIADGSSEVDILSEIQAAAAEDGITTDEMKVFLNISISDDSGAITELGDDNMLIFYIELAGMYQGYDSYYVYRYHTADDGTVTIDKITTAINDNGEYLEISDDGTTLVLHVSNFSVFGFAFENDYTVTFDVLSDADSDNFVETYTNGTVITAPANPTKADTTEYTYTFLEWNTSADGSGTAFVEGDTASSDVTYYAIFTESYRQYTITFNIDGTTIAFDSYYGSAINVTDPTKLADAQYTYAFAGWSPSEDGDVLASLPTVSAAATYYAVFTATTNTYTVIWMNGDVTLETDSYVEYGSTISYNEETPTKTATDELTYTFCEWNTSADGLGYTLNANDTVGSSVTYYAIFTATTNSYTITWVNGDKTTTTTVEYGTEPTPPTASKTADAEFSYTDGDWGTIDSVTGIATYIATFTATTNSYTITFGEDESTLAYGAVITAPETVPTKDATDVGYEYIFESWNTSADGTGTTLAVGATVSDTVTYYAVFTCVATEYTITYVGFGDTSSLLQTYTIDSDTITFIAPLQDGYVVTLDIISIEQGSTGDVTVTATCTPIEYAITYIGFADMTDLQTTYTIESETIAFTAQAKAGYSVGLSMANIASGSVGNATVIATYTAIEYTVAFGDSESTLAYGTAISAPANPTKDATEEYTYAFEEWNTSADGTGTTFVAGATVSGDVTYYAVFTATKIDTTGEGEVAGDQSGSTDEQTCLCCGNGTAFLGLCSWVWCIIIMVVVLAIILSIYMCKYYIRKNIDKNNKKK